MIGSLAMDIISHSRSPYNLHQRARHRILSDLGAPNSRLNQKFTNWWTLDFSAFRAEVLKALKHDLPLKDPDDWEKWLTKHRADHDRLTAEIVRLETDLNARVYDLFALTPAEILLIEESTKYPYGEV